MTTYTVQDLPNIDDPELIRCCIAAQQMRRTLCELTQHVVAQLDRNPLTTPTRVTLAALNRITEAALSTEFLCLKNRVRDAATLLLSLIELKLDLQYIALDSARATVWIEHARENTKPWKVAQQLREVYTNEDELNAEREIYRRYSMVKHCNPAGGAFCFPLAVSRDAMRLDLTKNNSQWIRIHLFGLGACLHRAGEAASCIWAAQGLDVGSFVSGLKAGSDGLSRYNEEHIISHLRAWPNQSEGDESRT